jgi:hypothetical protein
MRRLGERLIGSVRRAWAAWRMERGAASAVPGEGRAAEAREEEEGPGRLREGERLESGEAKGSATVVAGVGARERVWEEAWAVGRSGFGRCCGLHHR